MTGFIHQTQEGIVLLIYQRKYLFLHPIVIGIEMEGAKHCPVRTGLSALGNLLKEGLVGNLPQDFAAAHLRHRFAFSRHSGIFVCQVGVVRAGIQNAQRQSRFTQVKIDLCHSGLRRVRKIDAYHAANAGCHLIHQTAGLSKIDVFHPLSDLSDFNGRNLAFFQEQFVQDCPHQHFKGSAGGHTTSLGDIGRHIHIQPGQLRASLRKRGAGAPQNGRAGVFLAFLFLQIRKVNDTQVVAFAFQPQLTQVIGTHSCDHIYIDTTGQHPAVLVIGVISSDFGAPGGAE